MTQPDQETGAAAINALYRLWRMNCGASHGAFCVLNMFVMGRGAISIDDLCRFDTDNREAAMLLINRAVYYGIDSFPVSQEIINKLHCEHQRQTGEDQE